MRNGMAVMIRRSMTALVAVLVAVALSASDAPKFRAASNVDPVVGRYRVAVADGVEDVGTAAAALTRAYGGRLEPYAEEGFRGFAIQMRPSAARMLSRDPRVAWVEERSEEAGAGFLDPSTSLAGVDAATLAPSVAPKVSMSRQPRAEWEKGETYWKSGVYRYDGSGNVKSIGDDAYRYDGVGRLFHATAKTPNSGANLQEFRYDVYGNILSVTTTTRSGGPATMYRGVDSATNRLDWSKCTSMPCFAAHYDVSGNMTGIETDREYKWDALGMMTEGFGSERYVYDANDERIVTIRGAGTAEEEHVYTLRGLDQKVVRELAYRPAATTKWEWKKDYVYRDGVLMAAYVAGQPGAGPHRHYHVDHLGTPRLITDGAGFKLAIQTVWPFGVDAFDSLTDRTERHHFIGHERDTGGLTYMHARYYNPDLGRFLSVDPYLDVKRALREPQVWNRYAYAVNNPVNRVDPDGRADLKSEIASGVFGFLPIAGEIQDASIALTGFDPITAEQQSGWVRGASVAAVFIPFVGAKALGEGGEATARIVGNALAGARFEKAALSALGVADVAKTRIPSLSGSAAYRVPDALTARSLIEVKGVAKLGATNQIKDFAAFAKESGRQFILVVRKDTILTKELEKMAADGAVQIQRR